MRYASIDIGTNSVLLLVVEQQPSGELISIQDLSTITRLGQGVDQTGQLQVEAVARTLAALENYANELERLQVKERRAIGTSVLRDAQDSKEFLAKAASILGCPVEIIAGKREASLVLAGVRGTFGDPKPGTLIFDVGGGSTELILYQEAAPSSMFTSLDLGAVRFTERYLTQDPPSAEDMALVYTNVSSALSSLPAAYGRAQTLIGVSGTVTTLTSVHLALKTYDTQRVNGFWLMRQHLQEQIQQYARMSLPQRRSIVGLHPKRADVILAGALIVAAILDYFQVAGFRVCDRGVRWGLMWENLTR